MISLELIGICTACFLFGLLIGGIIAKYNISNKYTESSLKNETEIATLSEHIRNKTNEIEDCKNTINENELTIQKQNAKITDLHKSITRLDILLEKEIENSAEKEKILENSKINFIEAFKVLSSDALQENNHSFMLLAKESFSKYLDAAKTDLSVKRNEVKEIVKPVKDALEKYDKHINVMELEREKAYGGLTEQVFSLSEAQKELHKETGKLVKALQVPHIRGRWGEITLKRVAELSGMVNKCDFFEQETAKGPKNNTRPDMIVKLPGNRNIIVDAKVPLSAYLDALETNSEKEKDAFLETHAKHIQTHIKNLSQKSYFTQFKPSPEFVVLFIPGENFFSAALLKNPSLIEQGVEKNIVLATPTTLISLLKAVSYGWNQETSSKNAMAISQLGHELYKRLYSVSEGLNRLGRDIEKCSNTYNQVIGSLEKRVFVSARKFKDFGISLANENDLDIIDPVNIKTRQLKMNFKDDK